MIANLIPDPPPERQSASLRHLVQPILYVVAWLWRSLLFRTTFIAVAGSVGKTTAKELLAAILRGNARVLATDRNYNGRHGLTTTLLRVRPWHRYAVIEVGVAEPGKMEGLARLLRPDRVLMLSVGRNHSESFPSLADTAKEKARLLKWLRPSGVAALNGDDPHVIHMPLPPATRKLTFGENSSNDLRGLPIPSQWPQRFRCRVQIASQTVDVQTRFVGEHWLPSLVGALAVAHSCGLDLKESARLAEAVEPFTARLQPLATPSGAVILSDEYNGSIESFRPALRAFREASAQRRILVTGPCLDAGPEDPGGFRFLKQQAFPYADLIVFVSSGGGGDLSAPPAGVAADRWKPYETPLEAAEFLKTELRAGDLVLLKGYRAQHLCRLYFHLISNVACWKVRCYKRCLCEECPELGIKPLKAQRQLRQPLAPPGPE